MVHIGTAGWTIPSRHATLAPGSGSHLERYARTLTYAEINSSFYQSHRAATWQRWAASTPEDFRFSVKFPKAITHVAKLTVAPATLDAFFLETAALGEKLGAILVQLPPSLQLQDCPAIEFFEALRDRFAGAIALEPRHATWFSEEASDLLAEHRISRVAADPSREPSAIVGTLPKPSGWHGFAYYRLHGSPRAYYSEYDADYLAALAGVLTRMASKGEVWAIFDNTALGHAFANAVDIQARVAEGHVQSTKSRGRNRGLAHSAPDDDGIKSKSWTRSHSSSSNVD